MFFFGVVGFSCGGLCSKHLLFIPPDNPGGDNFFLRSCCWCWCCLLLLCCEKLRGNWGEKTGCMTNMFMTLRQSMCLTMVWKVVVGGGGGGGCCCGWWWLCCGRGGEILLGCCFVVHLIFIELTWNSFFLFSLFFLISSFFLFILSFLFSFFVFVLSFYLFLFSFLLFFLFSPSLPFPSFSFFLSFFLSFTEYEDIPFCDCRKGVQMTDRDNVLLSPWEAYDKVHQNLITSINI